MPIIPTLATGLCLSLVVGVAPPEDLSPVEGAEAPAPEPTSPAQGPEAAGPGEDPDPDAPTRERGADTTTRAPGEDPSETPAATEAERETSAAPSPDPAGTRDPAPLPEDLLAADDAEASIPERRPPPSSAPDPASDGLDPNEALQREYAARVRPADNPGLLRVAVHGLFLAASGKELAGRLGGVQAEIGQSWNRVGYGIGLAAYGGDALLGPDQYTQSFGMFGGGPTLSLGRTGLLRSGYLDLTAGYDLFYMPGRDSGFAEIDGASGEAYFVPHGPRLRLDLGLNGLSRTNRKLRHGMGISLGWQGLVSSVAGGDLPFSNVLMIGLSYMAQ